MSIDGSTMHAIEEVAAERENQDEKWGEQNHPFYSPATTELDIIFYKDMEHRLKEIVDALAEVGDDGWDYILLEEVFEALATEDVAEREKELIQVAAVALAAYESSRRNRGLDG